MAKNKNQLKVLKCAVADKAKEKCEDVTIASIGKNKLIKRRLQSTDTNKVDIVFRIAVYSEDSTVANKIKKNIESTTPAALNDAIKKKAAELNVPVPVLVTAAPVATFSANVDDDDEKCGRNCKMGIGIGVGALAVIVLAYVSMKCSSSSSSQQRGGASYGQPPVTLEKVSSRIEDKDSYTV